MALSASGRQQPLPCPFKQGRPACSKAGGVCSIRLYDEGTDGRISAALESPVITCPSRFDQDQLLVRWLAEIVGFSPDETRIAREIPFMQSATTNKPAGKIDLLIAKQKAIAWNGMD